MDKQAMIAALLAGKVLHGTTRGGAVVEVGADIGGGYYIRAETAGGYRSKFHKDTCERVVNAVFSVVGPDNDVVAINAAEYSW